MDIPLFNSELKANLHVRIWIIMGVDIRLIQVLQHGSSIR